MLRNQIRSATASRPAIVNGRLAAARRGEKIMNRLALLLIVVLSAADAAGATRKNVLLVTLDGLRQDHLSLNGYFRKTSPNIDNIAAQGVVFPNVIPSGCSTKASLTSLLTSIDYRHHHLIEHGDVLPAQFLTVAEVFAANGYQTAGFVASPMATTQMQYNQGFEIYRDFTDRSTDYVDAKHVIDEALAFLQSRRDARNERPFFIYAHLEEPHPPWRAASPWTDPGYRRERPFEEGCTYIPTSVQYADEVANQRRNLVAEYDGAIRSADEQLGRLLDDLKRVGELENTVIAISTDHGLELLDRYSATHGFNPFDEVVRAFLVLYDGGRPIRVRGNPPGRLQGRIIDVAPTLFTLTGISKPAAYEGMSLLDENKKLPRYAFTQCYDGVSVRTLDHKLIFMDSKTKIPRLGKDGFLFFDLSIDAHERRDVQTAEKNLFAQFQREYRQYKRDLATQFVVGTSIPQKDLTPESAKRLRSLGYIQ